jgi:pilus assembly protein CpaF
MPVWAIRKQVASGVDLIVQHDQLTDGSRKITYITEVIDRLEEDEVILKDIFRYEIEKVDEDKHVVGSFKAKGAPVFLPVFKKKGIMLDESIFKE